MYPLWETQYLFIWFSVLSILVFDMWENYYTSECEFQCLFGVTMSGRPRTTSFVEGNKQTQKSDLSSGKVTCPTIFSS